MFGLNGLTPGSLCTAPEVVDFGSFTHHLPGKKNLTPEGVGKPSGVKAFRLNNLTPGGLRTASGVELFRLQVLSVCGDRLDTYPPVAVNLLMLHHIIFIC